MELYLRDLLEAHDLHQPKGSIGRNLGDGYLFHHNRIYRNLRLALKDSGFSLSPNRLHDYDVLPLSQLPILLKKKVIPYSDNVNALREIEHSAKGFFTWTEIPPLKANYIMHESAHAVARTSRLKHFKTIPPPKSKKQIQNFILATLIEESFANTCECLANLDANDKLHDEFLYKNSYIMERPKDRATLRTAKQKLGADSLFRLTLLSYLHCNFLKTKWTSQDHSRVLTFSNISSIKPSGSIQGVIRIGLNLDPAFTQFTGSFCFRLLGIRGNIYEFLNFDFMKIIETDSRYERWINDLSTLVLR